MESIETSVENAIKGLEHRFSLDELDDWNTTNGLCKSIVAFTEKVLAGTSARLFYHEAMLHEYREIDREGLTSVADDTLFIGCLSMMTEAVALSRLFDDFQIEDQLLDQLLTNVYHAHTAVPIMHRGSMLAFLLLCDKFDANGNKLPTEQTVLDQSGAVTPETAAFLAELAERAQMNLYAAAIADRRLRQLLRMTEYPGSLRKYQSLRALYANILNDIEKEIPFDCGVCYAYEQEVQNLVPFSMKGLETSPEPLKIGSGISGHVLETRHALFVPERFSHPTYSLMPEEPFIDGSFISVPICTNKELFGVITLVRTLHNPHPFGIEHRYMMEIAAAFTANEIVNRGLYLRLEKSNFNVVESLTRALEAKDAYTEGHSARVTKYAEGIARELGYTDARIHQLRYGAMLHDIGKIGITDTIINKTERLTDNEYETIKNHTEIGYKIVSNNPFFVQIRNFIRYHHETLDGRGYYGRHEEEIPEEAMIISAADIFDALTSDRPYRTALPLSLAIEELKKQTGVHYSQKIFDAFIAYLEKEKPVPE